MRLSETGGRAEALDPLRESCDAFDQILKNRPGDMAFQRQYIAALFRLGSSLGRLCEYDEAGSVRSRAAELVADLCRKDPSNIFLLGNLMACKFNLALVLTRSGRRHEEAIAAYQESWKIGQQLFGGDGWSHGGSNASVGLIAMAYSLREVGRDHEAEVALVKGHGFLGKDSSGFYELARYDAHGAERLARTGGETRAVEDLKLQAMASLRKALALGFSDIQSIREFGEEYRFRHRPDFQLLLLDIGFPRDPFAPGP